MVICPFELRLQLPCVCQMFYTPFLQLVYFSIPVPFFLSLFFFTALLAIYLVFFFFLFSFCFFLSLFISLSVVLVLVLIPLACPSMISNPFYPLPSTPFLHAFTSFPQMYLTTPSRNPFSLSTHTHTHAHIPMLQGPQTTRVQ